MLLISIPKAQQKLAANIKALRLAQGLTQEGLAERADLSLPTLRKFEQKGVLSLLSFIKLCMALGCLEKILEATTSSQPPFSSIDDVLKGQKATTPKRGWKK
ncbi:MULTISPECIES: helix-turn-helix domain-containing protein [unclassified Imperialibacter]|uniref:helix-turn-helix domain-containing protein n=1 Tax=unclassified Imperialibacter TaxID=2629706 RepID=UPI001253E87A|nr:MULTISPECIES: helix-turn-helix transcriptional regulator [unclassified Imperialibacter]CAD5253943.1 XRE family transcriptional regulator [Imperialibacter sp. 89]CAD5275133.1 XRE family transcriptional regulator [Imperialibacter sp. 75]VVT19478.1 XRE family transcriptional regulator [Imperialibacter sp. EC-SDR9]